MIGFVKLWGQILGKDSDKTGARSGLEAASSEAIEKESKNR
jgi:hypothetical protein